MRFENFKIGMVTVLVGLSVLSGLARGDETRAACDLLRIEARQRGEYQAAAILESFRQHQEDKERLESWELSARFESLKSALSGEFQGYATDFLSLRAQQKAHPTAERQQLIDALWSRISRTMDDALISTGADFHAGGTSLRFASMTYGMCGSFTAVDTELTGELARACGVLDLRTGQVRYSLEILAEGGGTVSINLGDRSPRKIVEDTSGARYDLAREIIRRRQVFVPQSCLFVRTSESSVAEGRDAGKVDGESSIGFFRRRLGAQRAVQ